MSLDSKCKTFADNLGQSGGVATVEGLGRLATEAEDNATGGEIVECRSGGGDGRCGGQDHRR